MKPVCHFELRYFSINNAQKLDFIYIYLYNKLYNCTNFFEWQQKHQLLIVGFPSRSRWSLLRMTLDYLDNYIQQCRAWSTSTAKSITPTSGCTA